MGHPPRPHARSAQAGPTRESGNASSSRAGPTCESGNASSAPGPVVQPALSPEDSGSDSSSSPSVKRQRQHLASSSCAHSQSYAPPFDPGACGNHLKDKSRKGPDVWGKKGRNKLPDSYWANRRGEDPSFDFVLEFFKFRLDHNNNPMSNKLGMPAKETDGWWRFPILSNRSSGESNGGEWKTAWHGTTFGCIYSILYHEEMLESKTEGHMKKNLQGVYCHKADTAHKAENYMVFEDVGSNGHWWAAMLELSVDRSWSVGRTVGDQWVQPADSVVLRQLWVCGRSHEEMQDSSSFWVSPWNPKQEVNPITVFANGVAPLRAKRDIQARTTVQIEKALTSSLPFYTGPSTELLELAAEKESAAQQARQHAMAGTTEAVEPDVNDRDSFRPCSESDAADQDSTATRWSPSNSAAVVDPTVNLAVALTRTCQWCWSPKSPLCFECIISMKQKKARALDPEARWRLPCAASDLSEEFLEQMSEDAWDVYGTEEYSRLSDLFQDIDSWSDWDKDPIKEYLESMTNRAHQANALADAWVDAIP